MPPAPIQPDDFETQRIVQACWVDDLVLLLKDDDPASLIQKVVLAISLTQDLAAEFGLRLNYGKDKTAALVALRGDKATTIHWQLLDANPERPGLYFNCKSLIDPGFLDVVPNYIYLGQLQDHKGHPAAEMHRRFHLIQASKRLLRKNIFRSPRMPFRTKMQLHKSLVMSKLLYGSGAWQTAHIQSLQSWNTQLMQMYSTLAPNVKRGPHTYHLDVLADCGEPPPMMTLAQQRLNLFDRVVQTELIELLAVLQSQHDSNSWFAMILNDMQQLQDFCPAHPVFEISSQNSIELLARHSAHHPKALANGAKSCTVLTCKSGNSSDSSKATWSKMSQTTTSHGIPQMWRTHPRGNTNAHTA